MSVAQQFRLMFRQPQAPDCPLDDDGWWAYMAETDRLLEESGRELKSSWRWMLPTWTYRMKLIGKRNEESLRAMRVMHDPELVDLSMSACECSNPIGCAKAARCLERSRT